MATAGYTTTLSDVGSPQYGTDQYSIYATYTPTAVGGFSITLV